MPIVTVPVRNVTYVDVSVPTFYPYDDTPRGHAVDVLLLSQGYAPEEARDEVLDPETNPRWMRVLSDAYALVDKILGTDSWNIRFIGESDLLEIWNDRRKLPAHCGIVITPLSSETALVLPNGDRVVAGGYLGTNLATGALKAFR